MDSVSCWVSHYGYAGIFIALVLGIVGLPIPDESLLAFAGFFAYKGHLLLAPTMLCAFLGSIFGITISYGLGYTLGLYFLHRWGPAVGITPEKLDRAYHWYRRIGKWTLTFGYFVPGVRHLTAFVAGSSKLEFSTFARFAWAGGLLWSVSFVMLGYFFGKEIHLAYAVLHHRIIAGTGLILALLVVYSIVRYRNIRKANGLQESHQ